MNGIFNLKKKTNTHKNIQIMSSSFKIVYLKKRKLYKICCVYQSSKWPGRFLRAWHRWCPGAGEWRTGIITSPQSTARCSSHDQTFTAAAQSVNLWAGSDECCLTLADVLLLLLVLFLVEADLHGGAQLPLRHPAQNIRGHWIRLSRTYLLLRKRAWK